MRQKTFVLIMIPVALAILCLATNSALAGSKKGQIVHDGEFNYLKAQYGKKWA